LGGAAGAWAFADKSPRVSSAAVTATALTRDARLMNASLAGTGTDQRYAT
jgi:hypothetical protein